MPARHFTVGSGDKIQAGLGANGFAFGPGTLAALGRLNSHTTAASWIGAGAGTSAMWAFFYSNTFLIGLRCDTVTFGNSTTLTDGKWYIVAVTKATGNVAPRAHWFDIATNTWSHENCTGTMNNSSVPTTETTVGFRNGSAGTYDGDIAWVASWDVEHTDAEIERFAAGIMALFAKAAPKCLIMLDQDSTSQKIRDMTGNGADETTRTGTSLASASVPMWTPGGEIYLSRRLPDTTGLTPSSVVHTRALGTLAVKDTLLPGAIVHTRGVGTPNVIHTLLPASITHTRALGSPVVNDKIFPASIVHTRALGAPAVTSPTGGPIVARQWSTGDWRTKMMEAPLVKGQGEVITGG